MATSPSTGRQKHAGVFKQREDEERALALGVGVGNQRRKFSHTNFLNMGDLGMLGSGETLNSRTSGHCAP